MWDAVDEVGVGRDGGREADDRSVEAYDEDLGMLREGVRDVQVVGSKVGQPVMVALIWRVGGLAGDGNISASISVSVMFSYRVYALSG